jgi:(p)ppGpp synthase/HD superfamily hydrolase
MDLRGMILAMVDEPLVLVVKLADRLHNMRTVYALRPDRQRTVAAETMQVWCSLAERLGLFSLKVRGSSALSLPLSLLFDMPLCC